MEGANYCQEVEGIEIHVLYVSRAEIVLEVGPKSYWGREDTFSELRCNERAEDVSMHFANAAGKWRSGLAASCTTRVRDQPSPRLCSRASSSNMGKQYR